MEHRYVTEQFNINNSAVVFCGDCLDLLRTIPDNVVQLVVTSPPYNLGKEYECRQTADAYIAQQEKVIRECVRCLTPSGSICWQVGNFVENGSIVPLDYLLYPVFEKYKLQMRNRIVWRFEHGLHCSKRFSGRYETILWFTKSKDYFFNLDPVRIPQKYPTKKYFKGPRKGQLSCNPLGKNPGDVWDIPNVKSNHVEKTEHPCQYPIELVERLVLSLTQKGDWVLDPFLGVGTTVAAAIKHERRGAGAEIVERYASLARQRASEAFSGTLRTRPMNRPIHIPFSVKQSNRQSQPTELSAENEMRQMMLFGTQNPITMES